MKTARPPAPAASDVEWTVHLAARRPYRTLAALFAVGAAVLLSLLAFRSLLLAFIVAAGLLGSLADFLLPVTYRLTERGAEARHLWTFASIPWEKVKRRTMSNEGIKLSPLPRRSPLEPYRGALLRFGDEDPERILAAVRRLHGR